MLDILQIINKMPELHQSGMRGLLIFGSVTVYSVSQKRPPPWYSEIFSKRLEIFIPFFTHLLHDPFYTRLQIFIQISPTLTKLCHTKCEHLANFYISLEA